MLNRRSMGVLLWLLALCLACQAQTFYGSIVGAVADSTGASVPRTNLTLTNLATAETRKGQADTVGAFQFLNLVPGRYRLEAEATGFSRFVREPIVVEVQSVIRIDIPMAVGQVTEKVEVTAQTPLLQSETSSLGQVIESRKVVELPLNGRNVLNLVALVPSVVPRGMSMQNPTGTNIYAWGNYDIGGAQPNTSGTFVDGAPVNSGHASLLSLVPTQDSIQEFKVLTNNLAAEWGRLAGGAVNFTTKMGGNVVHGSAYEFLRNRVLNANTFFNNASNVGRPAFTQNQFGVSAGGPVVIPGLYHGRNKTFWFTSYGGYRQRVGQSFLLTVPTDAERAGDFSNLRDSKGNLVPLYDPTTTRPDPANPSVLIRDRISCNGALNVICPDKIDPAAKWLTRLWAEPNLPGAPFTRVNNFATNAPNGGDNDQFVERIDHEVSQKDRLFLRYTYWTNFSMAPDPHNSMVYGDRGPEYFNTHQAVIGNTYIFSPTMLFDFRLSYLRFSYDRKPKSLGFDLTQLGWPSFMNVQVPETLRTLPLPLVSEYSGGFSGSGTGSRIIDRADSYFFAPSLTKIWGRHTLKFGAEVRVDRDNYAQTNNASPSFSFNRNWTGSDPFNPVGGYGFASFLLGFPASGSSDIPSLTAGQEIYRAFYVDDSFQITRKLTLNLGLRYDLQGPWSERYDRLSFLMRGAESPLAAPTGLPLTGRLGLVNSPDRASRNNLNLNKKEFAPRLGFAYRLTNRTVLRGGYGIYWVPNNLEFWLCPNLDATNDIVTSMITTVDGGRTPYARLRNPFPDGILQPPGRNPIAQTRLLGQGLNTELPDEPSPYMQQWNFNIQQETPDGTLIDLAYAGSRGVHLRHIQQTINQLPDKYLSLQSGLYDQVPNPFYGLITTGTLSTATINRGQLLRPFPQYSNVVISALANRDSIYHSMQLKVEKRFKTGGSILAAYTISKIITNADSLYGWLDTPLAGSSTGYNTQNTNNLRMERTLGSFDVPQRLVVSYALDLPVGRGQKYLTGVGAVVGKIISGWGVNGVMTFQRGTPVRLTTAVNLTNSFGGGSRPNNDGRSAKLSGPAQERLVRWFDTSVFSQPPAFSFGNVSRSLPDTRGHGQNNVDFAVFKNIGLGAGDRMRLQFRTEFFNLFNRTWFGQPNGSYGSLQFGQVSTQINDPRLVQLALRLLF